MKKKLNLSFLISSVICVLPLIATLFIYDMLPESIVTHWGLDGKPNGYSPKAVAAIWMPVFFLAMNAFLRFAINTDPKSGNASKAIKSISRWILPVLSVVVYCLTVFNALGYVIDPSKYVMAGTGVLIIVIGNYLPKSRQSYTVGIKTPWALHDEENWNKTHRLAGPLWVTGGGAMVLGPFIPFGYIISAVVMSAAVLIPFVYSYMLYRAKK